MKVEIISCLQDNYSYLIIDETNNLACVVDPSEARPIIDYLKNKNINLKYILNTHHHFDHVGGNEKLKKNIMLVLWVTNMTQKGFLKLISFLKIMKSGKEITLLTK